jgi:hypothetical protein
MASLERERYLRFGWNAARHAVGLSGGLIVPWLVIRAGSTETWGQVQTPLIWLQLIVHITAWGSKDHLLKEFARHAVAQGKLLEGSISTRGVFLLLSILATIIDGRSILLPVIPAACVMFFNASLEPVIIWHKRFSQAGAADVLGLIGQVIYLTDTGRIGPEEVFTSIYLNQGIRLVLLLVLNWKVLPKGVEHWNFRIHVVAALPFFLTGFSGLLATRMDLYTANALLDHATLARYQIIASLFVQFQALAALIITPMRRNIYRLEMESVARYTTRMRAWAAIALLPMCAIAWAVLTYLFHFDTSPLILLAGAALVWPVFAYVPLIDRLYKAGLERSVMWANFAAASLSCLLTWWLLPVWGIAGGLCASAAGQWLMLAWVIRTSRKAHALS